LIDYLRADVENLMTRITLRDRSYERTMEQDYITALSKAYDAFYATYTGSPVLKIETDALDYIHRREDLLQVAEMIRVKLRQGPVQEKLFNL
jgi:deoxyguanosine kinase